MLRCVEEAGFGIAARSLPSRNNRASRLVEFSGHLGVEAEARQSALNVAALGLVEPDLIFGLLGCISRGRRINGCQLLADGGARTGLRRICTGENCQKKCQD